MSSVKRLSVLVLSLLLLETTGHGQCPKPDNLSGGGCCTSAVPALPNFPGFTQEALDIVWQECNVNQVLSVTSTWKNVQISPYPPSPCHARLMTLEIYYPGGLGWTGKLRRQYSRTWGESDGAGNMLQVWRFLVNGDLSFTPIAGAIPACAPVHGDRVRFTGYVDYARDCATGQFRNSWMISHVCDPIDHAGGFPRAGIFHPEHSFTFVGPSAGFVPGPLQPIEGTPTGGSAFEAVRRIDLPSSGATGTTCGYEESISYGLEPLLQTCWCSAFLGTLQWSLASLTLTGTCGTSITTPGGELTGFLSMGIGSWTIPAVYPGVERLRWSTGGFHYTDPCTGVTRHERFYGVTTIDGYVALQLPVVGPGLPLPLTFIDQSNSLRLSPAATVMNVPYISDHFIHLNH